MGRARGEEILTVCVDVEKLEAVVHERSQPHNDFDMTPAIFRRWIEQGTPTYGDKRQPDQKRRCT